LGLAWLWGEMRIGDEKPRPRVEASVPSVRFAARLGRATLLDVFRSFAVLAVTGVAALTGIFLGWILRVVHIAALRRILPGGIVGVSGAITLALARIQLVLLGLG